MAPRPRCLQATGWSGARSAALLLVGLGLLLLSNPALAHRLQLFASADGDQIQGRVYFVGGHSARGVEVHVLDTQGGHVAKLISDDEGRFRARVPAAADYRVVANSGDGHRAEWPIAASEFVGGFADEGHASAGGTGSVPNNAGASVPPSGVDVEPLSDAEGRAGTAASHAGVQRSGTLAIVPPSEVDSGAHPVASPVDCWPAGASLELALPVLLQQARQEAIAQGIEAELERALEQAVARQLLPLREALAEAQAQASFRDLLGGLGYIAGLAGLGLWWTRRRQQRESGTDKADG